MGASACAPWTTAGCWPLPSSPLQAGLADRAIGAADSTASVHDFSRRYPVHHREPLAAAARQWGVDEALLFGIIRQESRFNAAAKSRVGATGLMQLMPATARWVAKQIPLQYYHPALLTQPEVNVTMGTYYFHRVLTDLGDPVVAAAAYNAGPGRAKRWRASKPPGRSDLRRVDPVRRDPRLREEGHGQRLVLHAPAHRAARRACAR